MKKFSDTLSFILLSLFFTSWGFPADEKKKVPAPSATVAKAKQTPLKGQAAPKNQKTAQTGAKLKIVTQKQRITQEPVLRTGLPLALSSEEAVNRLLGVSTTSSAISPRPSDYIFSIEKSSTKSTYGPIYGQPNYSRYQSPSSQLRRTDHLRYPSIYQDPRATNLFFPRNLR